MENSIQLSLEMLPILSATLSGYKEVPAVFMQVINKVLHEHLYKGVLVYIDNILIYTETRAEHMKLVRAVLKKVCAAQVCTNSPSENSTKTRLTIWGHRISHKVVEMDPKKVQVVLEWGTPHTQK